MSGEPAELPEDRPNVLEQLQHSAPAVALTAMVEQLRRRLPDTDTSIDWEDGEVHSDGDTRG